MRDIPELTPEQLEQIYGPIVEGVRQVSADTDTREAQVLAAALWVAGVIERGGPDVVEKVRRALRVARARRPRDPLARPELWDEKHTFAREWLDDVVQATAAEDVEGPA